MDDGKYGRYANRHPYFCGRACKVKTRVHWGISIYCALSQCTEILKTENYSKRNSLLIDLTSKFMDMLVECARVDIKSAVYNITSGEF